VAIPISDAEVQLKAFPFRSEIPQRGNYSSVAASAVFDDGLFCAQKFAKFYRARVAEMSGSSDF